MNSNLKLLFKLLKQNSSVWQVCGFVVANLLGGIIVLIGLQAYQDFDRLMHKERGLINESYVVITKPVGNVSSIVSLLGVRPTFSKKEIAELKAHPSVSQLGQFDAANFELRGSFMIGDFNVSTDMFLESVPTPFIDVPFDAPTDWEADLNSEVIPLIISRRYLNLYNYVYASTKGLPQISEGITSTFPLNVRLRGNGLEKTYRAKVLGFTDRFNTILVPKRFLDQANEVYGKEVQPQPSRLVLETKAGRGDGALLDYFKKKGYRIEGDDETLRLQTLVNGVLWVVIGIGGIVSVLAFFLLLISIQLLIEKNKDKFVNLYSLGYTIRQIALPYLLLVAGVDTLVWLIAVLSVSIIYPPLFQFISVISPDLQLVSLFPLWCFALAFALVFILLHRWVILNQLRGICK
jgi:hypothetical protein